MSNAMNKRLVSNDFIRWHCETLQSHSEHFKSIVKQSNIPTGVLTGKNAQLSSDQFARLINKSIVIGNDESFGCLKRPLPAGCFQMMAYASISCRNLEEAINQCLKFYSIFNGQISWQLLTDDDVACINFRFKSIDHNACSYFICFTAIIIWRWLNWMVDKSLSLDGIEFQFSAPGCKCALERMFNRPIDFKKEHNALYFNKELLSLPIKQTRSTLDSFLIQVPECLMSHYQEDLSLVKRLRGYLQEKQAINRVTLSDVADHFHCSEQSLIRGLKAEGERFKVVIDSIQKQRAMEMLVKSNYTNQQIADQLGYSDTSVFYRCVKKWFKKTPSQIRKEIS
ncbi:AraC family transcriptional regulator ligand-binding domain-containing protein [Colwellia sp. MEBiC06753]